MHARFARLVLALLIAAILAPALAFAQGAEEPVGFDFETLFAVAGVVAGSLCGLYFVGKRLVDRMAARPQVDRWDEVKTQLDAITPYVEKVKAWADPENPSVPPSPGNPSGVSR